MNPLLKSCSVVFLTILLSACASLEKMNRAEPKVILIRNSLSNDIETVVLSGDQKKENKGSSRMGMISPVLKGRTQTFVRPSNPPPIPNKIRVSWLQVYEGTRAQTLDLSKALNEASGAADQALVIDFQPSGQVVAYLETVP